MVWTTALEPINAIKLVQPSKSSVHSNHFMSCLQDFCQALDHLVIHTSMTPVPFVSNQVFLMVFLVPICSLVSRCVIRVLLPKPPSPSPVSFLSPPPSPMQRHSLVYFVLPVNSVAQDPFVVQWPSNIQRCW